MTGKATVKIMYRLFRRSLVISAFVSASVPPISDRLPCVRVSVGRVVFGGDGDEGLLEAEAGDFDLARPVARVQQRVKRGVGVAGLDLHQVAPDLEVHHRGQAEQELLDHPVQIEGRPSGAGPRLDLGGVPSASSLPRLMTRIRS